MKRILLLPFSTSLYMFLWFYIARRFTSIDFYRDYISPAYLFAFLGFLLIFFISGQKLFRSFWKGLANGLLSFIFTTLLSFIYTLIAHLPVSIQEDLAITNLPYSPVESVFGLLNPMFKINASGFTWYSGDVFNGDYKVIFDQAIGIAVMLIIVSVVAGLGASYSKYQNYRKENKGEPSQI